MGEARIVDAGGRVGGLPPLPVAWEVDKESCTGFLPDRDSDALHQSGKRDQL